MITHEISVLFGSEDPKKAATIKCHDTGVNLRIFPKIEKKLSAWRSTTAPYIIPAGCTAVLKVSKPDKTYALTDGKIEGNSIYFEPHPQSFTAQGTASAEVNIFNAAGRRITTATFYLDVTKECASGCEKDSENCVDILAETIKAIKEAETTTVKAAEGAAADAKKAADSAKLAVNAAVNPPKLSAANTWLVWDAETGEYTDTGVIAVGKDGKPGDDYILTEADKSEILNGAAAAIGNAMVDGYALEPFGQKHFDVTKNSDDWVDGYIRQDWPEYSLEIDGKQCSVIGDYSERIKGYRLYVAYDNYRLRFGVEVENVGHPEGSDALYIDLGFDKETDKFIRFYIPYNNGSPVPEVHIGVYSPPNERKDYFADECATNGYTGHTTYEFSIKRNEVEAYIGKKIDKFYCRLSLVVLVDGAYQTATSFGFKGDSFVNTYHSALNDIFPHVLHLT